MARGIATLVLGALAGLAAGCSDIESLTGSDEDEPTAALTLTADHATLPPNGSTTVRVKATGKDGSPVADGTPVEMSASRGTLDPASFRAHDGGTAAVTYRAGGTAGPATIVARSGDAQGELTISVVAAAVPVPAPPAPSSGPAPGAPVDLRQVTWIDPDISSWPETSRITSASIGAPPICIDHTKAGRWPVKDGLEGNPWVIVNLNGRWYAATYEWLAPGQICKSIHAGNIGEHIGRPPLASWRPRSGDLVGLMVSARARFRPDTVRERSNVVWLRWP